MVRQFGFSQGIPGPLNLDPKSQICNSPVSSFDEHQVLLEQNNSRKENFIPIDVEPNSLVSESFLDWWFEYYQTQYSQLSECKARLVMKDPSREDQDEELDDQGNEIVEMVYTPFFIFYTCVD